MAWGKDGVLKWGIPTVGVRGKGLLERRRENTVTESSQDVNVQRLKNVNASLRLPTQERGEEETQSPERYFD